MENRKNPKIPVELTDDKMCFVCGSLNRIGLQLTFILDEHKMSTEFTPKKEHQGFAQIVHGGIIATILDETMLNLLYRLDIPAVTAELNVKFLKPCMVGEKLEFRAEIAEDLKRIILTSANVKNSRGQLVATATAKCVPIRHSGTFKEKQ